MPAPHGNELIPAGIGHPRVRQFLNIKHNRVPNPTNAITLEGLWAIRCALRAAIDVEVVFVCPALLRGGEADRIVRDLRRKGTLALAVSERVVRRMIDRDGPDGLAAIAHLRSGRWSDIAVGAATRIVIADSFELPGNLGTLIRCADGAGASGVVVTDRRVRVNHPLVLKASMGTVLSMPIVIAERSGARIWLRARGVRIVAADPAATLSYRAADLRGPVAIVLGGERCGVAPFWHDAADFEVAIPMLGAADSLNVGHAAALLLYEALHQNRNRSYGVEAQGSPARHADMGGGAPEH